MHYFAPYQDMQFLMAQAYHAQDLGQFAALNDFDLELAQAVIEEAGKFATGVLAPLNVIGDRQGCRFDQGKVTTPAGWHSAYQQFKEAGWIGLALPQAFGGQGLPKYIAQPVNEMWLSANLAFVMFQALAQGGAEILLKFASPALQQRYLPAIVSGEWTVAMALTEPGAGSDLGALTTKAWPQADGRYRLKGQKIYITYGEHDLTENIVHLVLARTPDAPAGSRGISLFAVPKYRVSADGSLADFNDVRCTGIEHKTGLHGSPTCSISYGDQDDCYGELIGSLNQGLTAMFVLMNEARLSCGLQGVALGEVGWQRAVQYASERRQGQNAQGRPVAIIEHADVKRMLLSIRAEVFGLRALGYQIAAMLDAADAQDDPIQQQQLHQQVALLTPIFKGFATERANSMAGTTIQIFGGMGFVEETGVAQLMRDARITTIYEGTTGIQAKDLLHRKIIADQGQALVQLMQRMQHTFRRLASIDGMTATASELQTTLTHTQRLLTQVLLTQTGRQAALEGVSVPLLHALGILCCAWQLAQSAITAQSQADLDPEFTHNLIALLRFYAVHRLPIAMAAFTTVAAAEGGMDQYRMPIG